MKILIVEDDDLVASLYARHLQEFDFDVVIVGTIREAFEAMRRIPPPGLIFLDIFLPDSLTPEETLSHIAQIRLINPDAIVIVMTGLPNKKLEVMARAVGADEFRFKQQMTSQAELLRATKAALEKRRDGMGNAEASQAVLEKLTAYFCKETVDPSRGPDESLTA